MVKFSTAMIPALAALAASSCVPPKAVAVEETATPPPVAQQPVPEVTAEVEPEVLPPQDDGIRMSGLLELPDVGDYRATNPGAAGPGPGSGAVISRPPTDPPPRVKPED